MEAERVKTESNEAGAMEIKAQVFEADMARARHIWMENAIKAEIAEVEEREQRSDIEEEEHVRFLG